MGFLPGPAAHPLSRLTAASYAGIHSGNAKTSVIFEMSAAASASVSLEPIVHVPEVLSISTWICSAYSLPVKEMRGFERRFQTV